MSTHPNDNWLGDEWSLVPPELHEKAFELAPFCDLVWQGDTLLDIVDNGTAPPEPEPEPSIEELLNLILVGELES